MRRQRGDLRAQRRPRSRVDVRAHPREPLDDDVDAAVRRLGHLPDDTDRSNSPQILGRRLVGVVVLQDEEQEAVASERPVDAFHRYRAIHGQWQQRLWKDHRVPEWQHWEL